MKGDTSTSDLGDRISSFTVYDELLLHLTNTSLWPNLELSSSREAAPSSCSYMLKVGGKEELNGASMQREGGITNSANITHLPTQVMTRLRTLGSMLTFIGSPSSVVYFDERRPVLDDCDEDAATATPPPSPALRSHSRRQTTMPSPLRRLQRVAVRAGRAEHTCCRGLDRRRCRQLRQSQHHVLCVLGGHVQRIALWRVRWLLERLRQQRHGRGRQADLQATAATSACMFGTSTSTRTTRGSTPRASWTWPWVTRLLRMVEYIACPLLFGSATRLIG